MTNKKKELKEEIEILELIEEKNSSNQKKVGKRVNKKKRKWTKKMQIRLLLFVLVGLFGFSFLFFFLFFPKKEKDLDKKEETISYIDYYYDTVKMKEDKKLYQFVNGEFEEVGILFKDRIVSLEKGEYLEKGYFKIKGKEYYIDYQNLLVSYETPSYQDKTYLNYIPFNEKVKTENETTFYKDEKLVYSLNKGMEFPLLIKEEDFYGVLVEGDLYYLKKEDCKVEKVENTGLKHTTGIAALTYHFTYDASNEEEEKECKKSNATICLSDVLFKKQLTYLKENHFYTATMKDLEMFIDGKIQLPEKTVVLTIDDGYFVKAAIKVLEELDLHATLFLIGKWFEPEEFASKNLEIHSHSYALHYPGACPGGQGSPLKCLKEEVLLADLKKSREQLNGSTVFCYPFFEYNEYAIRILKEAGFTMAFTGKRSKIRLGSDKYRLPRFGIINETTIEDLEKIVN